MSPARFFHESSRGNRHSEASFRPRSTGAGTNESTRGIAPTLQSHDTILKQALKPRFVTLVAGALIAAIPVAVTEEPAQAPAPPTAAKNAAGGTMCEKEIAAIRQAYKGIPKDFRQIDHTKIEQIAKTIHDFQLRLQAFTKNCDADKLGLDTFTMLARMRTALETRVRPTLTKSGIKGIELAERMRDYNDLSIQYCQKTLDLLAAVKDEKVRAQHTGLHCETLDLQGDIQFKINDYDAALQNYLKLLEVCPSYPGVGTTVTGAARAYKALGRTTEGIAFISKYIKSHYKLPDLPFFYEALWNLLVTDGDIDGMVQWCKTIQEIFPLRMMRADLKKYEKDGYRRYLGFSGFRIGYSLLARGDLSGAAEAFQKHVEDTDKLERDLASINSPLPKELEIYKTRSLDNLHILETAIGDPPGADLELEEFWATPRRVTLSESRGKAVAILFRGDDDRRSKHFMSSLDKNLAENPDNKEFVVLHYMKGSRDLPGQLSTLQDNILEMGIEAAAVGMDPDAERRSLFRAFKATVGTATFMIFDREGNLAWWQQDPRGMDAKLAVAIWERLANE